MPSTSQSKFSLRNVTCDHYMAFPNASLDPTSSHYHRQVTRVPVVRVFGILDSGQKCCLHVHGVLPYILLECQIEVDSTYADQFAEALDAALNLAASQRPNANGRSSGPHVHKVKIVKGLPYYGYYRDKKTFLKISLYNPAFLKLAVELVQRGAIMQTVFQPYEAHVPYILKFFLDYSIYGMDYVHLTSVKFRVNRDEAKATDGNAGAGPSTIGYWSKEYILDNPDLQSPLEPVSTLELEADCLASDILNRNLGKESKVQNPGLDVIWRDERQRFVARRQRLEDFLPSSQERPGNDSHVTGTEALFRDQLERVVDEMRMTVASSTPSSSLSSLMLNNSIVDEQVVMDITNSAAFFANASSQDSFVDMLADLQAQGDAQVEGAAARVAQLSFRQPPISRTPSTFHDDQRIDAGAADTSIDEDGDEAGQGILDELEMSQQLISFRIDDERSGGESDSVNRDGRVPLDDPDVATTSTATDMSYCSPGVSSYRPPRQVATAVLHGSIRKRSGKDGKSRADPARYSKHRKVTDESLDDADVFDPLDSEPSPLKQSSSLRTVRISSDDLQPLPSTAKHWPGAAAATDRDASAASTSPHRNDSLNDNDDNLLSRSTSPVVVVVDPSAPLAIKTEPFDLHFNLTDPSDSDSDDSVRIISPKSTLNVLTELFDGESDDGESEKISEKRKRRRKKEKEGSSGDNSPTVVEFDLEDAVDRPLRLDDVHIRVCRRADERRSRRTFHLGGRTVTASTLDSDDCSGFGRERLVVDPLASNMVEYYSSNSLIVTSDSLPHSSGKKRQQKAKRSTPFLSKTLASKLITSTYDDDDDEFISLAPMLSGDVSSGDSLNSGQKSIIDVSASSSKEAEGENMANLNESGILINQREDEERAEESRGRRIAAVQFEESPDYPFDIDSRRPSQSDDVIEFWLSPTVAPPDPSEVRSWIATRQATTRQRENVRQERARDTEDEHSAGSQSFAVSGGSGSGARKPRALRTNRRVARRLGPRAVDLENSSISHQAPHSTQSFEQLLNNSSEVADDCDSTSFSMDLFLEEDSAAESEIAGDDRPPTATDHPRSSGEVRNEIIMQEPDQSSEQRISETRCADDNSLMMAGSNVNNTSNINAPKIMDNIIASELRNNNQQQPTEDEHIELLDTTLTHAVVEARDVEMEDLNRETDTPLLFSDEREDEENAPYNLQRLMERSMAVESDVGSPARSIAQGGCSSGGATTAAGGSWQFPSAEVESREQVMSPILADAPPVAVERHPADHADLPLPAVPERPDSFLNVSSFCPSAPRSTLAASSHTAASSSIAAPSLSHSTLYDSEPLFDGFDNFDEFARAILPASICDQSSSSGDGADQGVWTTAAGECTTAVDNLAHSLLNNDHHRHHHSSRLLHHDPTVSTLLETIGQHDDVDFHSIPTDPLETIGHSVDATCDGWLLPQRANGVHHSSINSRSPIRKNHFPNLVADADVSSAAVVTAGNQPLSTLSSPTTTLNGVQSHRAPAGEQQAVLANLRQCDVERVLMELEESSAMIAPASEPNLADLDAQDVGDIEQPHELEGTYPYDEYQDAIASSVDFVDETGQPLTFEQIPIAAPVIHQIQVFLGSDRRKEPKGRRGRPPGSGRRRQAYDEATLAANAIQGFDGSLPPTPSRPRRPSPSGQVFVLDESRYGHSDANQVVSSVISVLKTQMKSNYQQRRPVGRPPRALSDESDFERPSSMGRRPSATTAAMFKRRPSMYSDSDDDEGDHRRKRRRRSRERDPDWMRAQSDEESDRAPTPTHRRRRTTSRNGGGHDDRFHLPRTEPDTTEVCKMLTRAIPEAFENMNEPESVSKIVSALEKGLQHFTRKLKMQGSGASQAVYPSRDRQEGQSVGESSICEQPKSTTQATSPESISMFVPNAPSSSSRAEMNPFRIHIRRPVVSGRSPTIAGEMKPKRPRGRPRKIRPVSPVAYQQRTPYMLTSPSSDLNSAYLNSPSTPVQSAATPIGSSMGSPTAQVSSTTRIGDSPQAFDMSSSPSFASCF